ncbi:MAG: hypothetical protein QOF80_1377 [Verrucomicrobiota bacterium]|jgi:hypothetical protein
MATKPRSKTGSAKLSSAGRGFSAAKLSALVAILKKYKLDKDIIINGKPQPDFIKGRFTTKDSAAVVDVLRRVIQFNGVSKGIVILPNGQPPVIDRFDVEIRGIRA